MSEEVSGLKKAISLWSPFAFCVFLCGLVVFTWKKTGNIEAAYPAFFCFLPMTFLFMGLALVPIRRELKRLSDRIDQLEKHKE